MRKEEREELHRAIWAIADDLRGSVDGWDFKQYILGVMFYRYISEHLEKYIDKNEHASGNASFAYAKLSDDEAETVRDEMVNDIGFFILPSELFCNVRKKAPNDENLNETLERVFKHIEESSTGTSSEGDFSGLFDDIDVNSNKLGATVAKRNDKLTKILNGIGNMKLEYTDSNKTDAFGDAYEYLMSMYASNAGKSGGEFFTPQEVSELLMRLATVDKTEVDGVYDPACGSGSLLLKAEEVLGKGKVHRGFFGQEINITTYNLCRINMFLHGIGFDKFSIACEDTLISPQHWDNEPFEVIVSNPPYSIKWAGDENPLLINDPRFAPAGILAPKGKADFAFIMHSLAWLKTNGTAAIVIFPTIMSRPGAEQKIRKYLVENNFIDSVIRLPENLFFGTPIPTCILVLKKSKSNTDILFIDAADEYVKVTNNNKLTNENISNIVKIFKERKNVPYVARVVNIEEIQSNDYNLMIPTYIKKEEIKEEVNVEELKNSIVSIRKNESSLREKMDICSADIEKKLSLLSSKNSKNVLLSDFFSSKRGVRLKQSDRISGDIPLVTAGFQNDGIAGYITNQLDIHENAITIDMFGNSFWRPYKFSCDDNIIVLTHPLLNDSTAYYFLSAIKTTTKGYDYSNQYRIKDLKKHFIKIPILPNGELNLETIHEISACLGEFEKLSTEYFESISNERDLIAKQFDHYREEMLKTKD